MRITTESRISDILQRYPSTGPVFIQSGRLYVNRPGELYARFPELSVEEFARQNGIDLSSLLRELDALAGSEEAAWSGRAPRAVEEARGDFSLTLGYTGSYRPGEDSAPQRVSVVATQSARGPE
ncbi:MAG TPA: hypothetical protein VFO18_01260 [Methylomirabilota bacterium]|nr:hypothetical protein [Methylomirabilota bacterium]